MKKIMLLLVLVFCISVIYSQKFYVKGSIEYSLGLLNDKQVAYSTVYNYSTDPVSSYNIYENFKMKLGNGYSPSFSTGYMINSNFGFEVSARYFFGNECKVVVRDDYMIPYNKSSASYIYRYSAKTLNIVPSIVLLSTYGDFNLYTRIGFALGFGKIEQQNAIHGYFAFSGPSSPFVNIEQDWETQGNKFYGVESAFGFEYMYFDNFYFFGELRTCFQTYSPDKLIMTSYTYEGEDQLSQLPLSATEIDYSSEYNENITVSDNTPSQSLQPSYFINSIGLNVGFKICF